MEYIPLTEAAIEDAIVTFNAEQAAINAEIAQVETMLRYSKTPQQIQDVKLYLEQIRDENDALRNRIGVLRARVEGTRRI